MLFYKVRVCLRESVGATLLGKIGSDNDCMCKS